MLRKIAQYLRPSPPPDFWSEYLQAFQQSPLSRHLPLAQIPFVVFDTETTGLNPRKDNLLSIGAVRVQGWQLDVGQCFELYVQQSYQPQSSAVEVHGILPGQQPYKLPQEEAVKQFLKYCGNAVLVAHHLAFDLAVLNALLRPLAGDKLRNKGLDTARLARRVAQRPDLAKPGTFGLDELCEQFHIPKSDRHTAAGDAYITGLLLLKLLYRLKKRGVRTLGDLLAERRTGLR